MKAEVKAVRHADIRGKELLYLTVENEAGKKLVINIGEKTFKALQELDTVLHGSYAIETGTDKVTEDKKTVKNGKVNA